MGKERECAENLRRIVGTETKQFDTFVCHVNSVNGATCEVKRLLDDKIIPDVRLNCSSDASHGIVVVPKVGSAVLVTSIADDDNFVAQFSEIDKITIVANTEIVINGGSLGGLIKIEELKNNLKSLKDYCEALKSAIATGLTSVGASTAASGEAGAQAFNGEMIGKTISFSDMEDKNVKH